MTEYVTKFTASFANPDHPLDENDNSPNAVFDTFAAAVAYLTMTAQQCLDDIGPQGEDEQWYDGHRQSLTDLIAALAAAPGPELTLYGGGLDWWVSPIQVDPAWDAALTDWLATLRASRPEPTEPEPF